MIRNPLIFMAILILIGAAAVSFQPVGKGAAVYAQDSLLQPSDLVYEGAFRLPARAPDAQDAETWEYGGQALTYRPDGDPGGEADGYPGSLFGTGHDVWNYVSEISIPAPSLSRNVNELPVATTIQGFHDVRAELFDGLDEMPRVGLQYLPPQAGQTSGLLHLAWGQHHHDIGSPSHTPSHAWSNLDLSMPDTAGAWWIRDVSLYSVNGYMFEIPQEWADAYAGGARLATGRYRDGGWSGRGPTLFAYAPWQDGNPPAPGAHLTAHTLLLYSYSFTEEGGDSRLNGYHDSDMWEGGAWLTAGDRSTVVFVGTKGGGDNYWYGYTSPAGDGAPCPADSPDGVMCFNTDGTPCAPELIEATVSCPGHIDETKGWWSSRFDAQIIFYDPADFAAVANGTMSPDEPQPYAVLDIDENLFLSENSETWLMGSGDQRNYRVGEMSYDRERGLLYIFEWFADEAQPVVHVWRIGQ